jgi:hypothetical protein
MSYECAIENKNKYGIRLMHNPTTSNRDLMWVHDVDGKYFTFPNQSFLTAHKIRKSAVQKMSSAQIGIVVDSLIMHPIPHQHIESPVDNHEIRLGGGLLNPFLYLFHLRIQLCPNEIRRISERNRLILLFETAIKANSIITPCELMKIPNEN